MCETYLLSYYRKDIIDILKDPDDTKHFSVDVEFVELIGNDTALAKNFLEEPEKALQDWDTALGKLQTNLILQSENQYVFKKNCHCRIYKFPLYPDFHRVKFPLDEDLNKFLEVSGTVIRTTAVKMLEYQRQYICTKCKYVIIVDAVYELKNIIDAPKTCTNPENCKSTSIVSLGELNADFCKDYQEIKIQETISKLDVGSIPNSMWVTLEDDLVDTCKPGDNVTVCGFIKIRHDQFYPGKRMDLELVIKANHVRVDNASSSAISIEPKLKDMFQAFWKTYAEKPLVARDIILKSICPQLFGLFTVKLAMAVVLAGGSNVQNTSSTGVRVRTEPHLLLVGDPGTGKSQLLRFASKIIPRSVLTTGVGSTAAGLTVAAVMENGEWQLEGGALVMADGGICCIDEFNTMKEHDRTSIHEAMEQQTISVAKASIVCKLSTRCSVLAATNPKGNLDPSQPLNMNVALASPLLSRFDLILLIRDRIDEEWDSQLVDYIFTSEKKCTSANLNWTVETLQAYYAVIKNIHPVLTEDSNKILGSYYQAQRRRNCRNKSRTTVRLLDSLVRLSQGHARLMCHEEVEIVDAVTAVLLVETASETDSSLFNLRFDVRADFPYDPMKNYQELVEIILSKLGLDELLQKELAAIHTKKMYETTPKNTPNTSQQKESKFFHVQEISKSAENNKSKSDAMVSSKEEARTVISDDISENTFPTVETANVQKIEKTSPRSVRTKKNVSKECDINNDLAALKRMRSINDIFFPEENCILDDENGFPLNFNENELREKDENSHAANESRVERVVDSSTEIFSRSDIMKERLQLRRTFSSVPEDHETVSCYKEGKQEQDQDPFECEVVDDFADNSVNNNKSKARFEASYNKDQKKDMKKKIGTSVIDEAKNTEEIVLTQRTKTKNFFSKFKFIPKDNKTGSADQRPEEGPNENFNDFADISFANVQSSTQPEVPAPKNDKKTHMQVEKKTTFKKDADANVREVTSMFESQEDLEDLDLDI